MQLPAFPNAATFEMCYKCKLSLDFDETYIMICAVRINWITQGISLKSYEFRNLGLRPSTTQPDILINIEHFVEQLGRRLGVQPHSGGVDMGHD